MNTLKNLALIFLLATIFSNCGNSESELETKFAEVIGYITDGELGELYVNLDKESIKYLDDLGKAIGQRNKDRAATIGKDNDLYLSSLFMYEQLKSLSSDTTNFDGPAILFLMYLNRTGILRSAELKKVSIKEFGDISATVANVKVRIPTGVKNTSIVSNYEFKKEAENWKLNLLSTMKFNEKLLNKQLNQTDKFAEEFIKDYVKEPAKQIEFKYRKKL